MVNFLLKCTEYGIIPSRSMQFNNFLRRPINMYTKESHNEQLNLFSDKLLAPFVDTHGHARGTLKKFKLRLT